MQHECLISLTPFSPSQRIQLDKGKIRTIGDLLLTSIQDLSRRCKVPPLEAQRLVETFCRGQKSNNITRLSSSGSLDELFTTGDDLLDEVLEGGLRTGMIWDISGESAAGKTQLGLQLSLCIQLPQEHGGLSASACYLTTSSILPTTRLLEISNNHPVLKRSNCTLDDVHTISVPTIAAMLHVLSKTLPSFIAQKLPSKPVKLVIIDSLAELFHSSGKTTTSTLVERSHDIAHIASLLHVLASNYGIAIVAMNEVIDAVERLNVNTTMGVDVTYNDQSWWFNSAASAPGENGKKTSLGLTWANQINNRIILSRTGRRRHVTEGEVLSTYKRLKVERNLQRTTEINEVSETEAVLIRRLTIVFSSYAFPRSLDYIITKEGFLVLAMAGLRQHVTDDTYQASSPAGEELTENPPLIGLGSDENADWDSLLPAEYSYDGVDWDTLEKDLADSGNAHTYQNSGACKI